MILDDESEGKFHGVSFIFGCLSPYLLIFKKYSQGVFLFCQSTSPLPEARLR